MTYECAECNVRWWPYQAQDGKCPECGKGTKRKVNEVGDIDADARYKVAQATRREREASAAKHREFDAYYADREARLNGLDALPVAEPHRSAAA